MKLFVKLIFVANFLFLGGGFLIAFFQFIAYNGFGDIFEYVKPEQLETHVNTAAVVVMFLDIVPPQVQESVKSYSDTNCDIRTNDI